MSTARCSPSTSARPAASTSTRTGRSPSLPSISRAHAAGPTISSGARLAQLEHFEDRLGHAAELDRRDRLEADLRSRLSIRVVTV